VAKANLEELMKKFSDAFKRPYSEAAGLCFERVLDKGERE